MDRLTDVSIDRLRDALAAAEGKRATLRVVVGINYAAGVSPATLSEWYGISRTTVYNWLDRLEDLDEMPAEAALRDEPRPGRPPKLDAERREQLRESLREPPAAAGYEAEEWHPRLVRRYLAERFGVEYSLRHVRRLVGDL